MRPRPVIWFEWIFLITLFFPIIGNALDSDTFTQNNLPIMATPFFVTLLILKVIMVFLVSRKRNRVALWILIILTALAILNAGYAVLKMGLMFGLLKLLIIPSIQAIALALLFLPVSKQWIEPKEITGSLKDTFS